MHRVLIPHPPLPPPPCPRPSHHKQSSYVSLSMEDDPFEGKGPLNRYVLRIFCSISVSFFPPPLCSSLRYSNSTMTEGKAFSPSIKASFPLWGVGFFYLLFSDCAQSSPTRPSGSLFARATLLFNRKLRRAALPGNTGAPVLVYQPKADRIVISGDARRVDLRSRGCV